MRTTLTALALVLVACGGSDRATTPAHDAPTATNSGPDQLVLQVPRNGGLARVLAYPAMDSVIWSSTQRVPSARSVLAFDENAGSLVVVDERGAPVRIDFRLGGVDRQESPALTELASSDGWSIYGLGEGGRIVRLTPPAAAGATPWTFTPPVPATQLGPQPDGSLLVIARNQRTHIFRLRPPDTTIFASAELPRTQGMAVSGVGDRVYFVVDTGLVSLRPRDLQPMQSARLRGDAASAAATPSGDRVYIVTSEGSEISIFDRYRGSVANRIPLPGTATDLRMDPTGRLLLARAGAGADDSIWVISLARDAVIGSAPSAWRDDLPAVAPDGAVAVLRGADVALLDPQSLAVRQRVEGGAASVWHFFAWSGFRPRPAGLDEPATFPEMYVPEPGPDDEIEDPDEVQTPPQAGRPVQPIPAPERVADGYFVQFAALRSEETARELAREIRIDGPPPRVVSTLRDGVPIFRVLAGPYPAREEAERIGRETGRSYWVYEGTP